MTKQNSWLALAIRGMGIGFPITLLCMTLIGGYNGVIQEFLIWMVASALFGVLSGLVFIKGNFSLPVATLVHGSCCLIVAVTAVTLIGYGDSFVKNLLAVVPVFVVVYGMIYLSFYAQMKREEKKINEELNKQ